MIFKIDYKSGYQVNKEYIIQLVPNITNITYGRDVGYAIESESFDSKTESISATKIRKAYARMVNYKYMAGWQSGHAADCKSVYAGSIPASASK